MAAAPTPRTPKPPVKGRQAGDRPSVGQVWGKRADRLVGISVVGMQLQLETAHTPCQRRDRATSHHQSCGGWPAKLLLVGVSSPCYGTLWPCASHSLLCLFPLPRRCDVMRLRLAHPSSAAATWPPLSDPPLPSSPHFQGHTCHLLSGGGRMAWLGSAWPGWALDNGAFMHLESERGRAWGRTLACTRP